MACAMPVQVFDKPIARPAELNPTTQINCALRPRDWLHKMHGKAEWRKDGMMEMNG